MIHSVPAFSRQASIGEYGSLVPVWKGWSAEAPKSKGYSRLLQGFLRLSLHFRPKLIFQSSNMESRSSCTCFASRMFEKDCVPAVCAASSHISKELISAGKRVSRYVSADLNRARPGKDRQYLLRSGMPLRSTAWGDSCSW